MIDAVIATVAIVAVIVGPIWLLLWGWNYYQSRDTVDATADTGATLFGAFVTLFAGVLVVTDQMVVALGFTGDLLAQFPNLIAYAALSVGTWLGLAELGQMGNGLAATIALGSVLLVIMIREGSSDDAEE